MGPTDSSAVKDRRPSMFNGGALKFMGVTAGGAHGHTPDQFIPFESILSKCGCCGGRTSFIGNDVPCVCFPCEHKIVGGGASAFEYELCTVCVEKMAEQNGRDTFKCSRVQAPITNNGGTVAEDKPRWSWDDDFDDEIDDDQECDKCGNVGLLVLCDVCDTGLHHQCAGIDPAFEPDSWTCESCSAATRS